MSSEQADRPRDAASVVLFDDSSGELRVLMGRRQPTQVFMPGKYVFPGGRVDREDHLVSSHDTLDESEQRKLLCEMQNGPTVERAYALVRAGVREAFEEAGLVLGRPEVTAPSADVAKHPSWQAFYALGHVPVVSTLTFFARAITPPGRPRRFDTRFFCANRSAACLELEATDGELSELGWYSMAEIEPLDLAPITRIVLEEFRKRISAGPIGPSRLAIPLYNNRDGVFDRRLLGP